MKYAGIIKDDIAAAPGISVTFFTQGCPHHCPGCHNPETWDFDGGKDFTEETMEEIYQALQANGISRNLCIMGGEPLCDENAKLTYTVISKVKQRYPNIKIYIWSGYYYQELLKKKNPMINLILQSSDYLIDGPFLIKEKDITLKMRGSRNQHIIQLT